MPKAGIPDRIVWAVETLDVKPSDYVLEIGCGHGLAAPLVCEKFGRGTLTAIDRSPKMIAAAEKRNRTLVDAGKVRFKTVALADADFGRRRFSKIFAINVNLFWIDPAAELPVIRRLLQPRGVFYLFYQPPRVDQLKSIAARLARNLEAHAFTLARATFSKSLPSSLLCVIARAEKEVR